MAEVQKCDVPRKKKGERGQYKLMEQGFLKTHLDIALSLTILCLHASGELKKKKSKITGN